MMERGYKDLQIGMTGTELRLGWAYLAVNQLLLPWLLAYMNVLLPTPLSSGRLNFLFFCINFVSVLAIFQRFLWKSLKIIRPGPFLWAVVAGFLFYYAATTVVTSLILWIDPAFSNVNDAGIAEILQEDFTLMAVGSILLVPVVEETLFRGLIFRSLWRKSRAAAYVLSAAVFAAIHVVSYIGLYSPLTLALCFLQYIPAGVWLARAYVSADTIFAPILIHMLVNTIGIFAMR